MRKKLFVALLLVMALLGTACGSATDSSADSGGAADSTNDGTYVGEAMPEFATHDIMGNEVTNEVFKDAELTVVNVWGTFCGPCIEEMLFGDKKTWDKHKLIPSADGYEKVYEGIIVASCADDKKILEILFRLFNINCLSDFKGHSVSVSDVIVLKNDSDEVSHTAYFVDAFGWKTLSNW